MKTGRSNLDKMVWKTTGLDLERLDFNIFRQTTSAGFEPAIFGSVDRRVIHCATRPRDSLSQKRVNPSLPRLQKLSAQAIGIFDSKNLNL
ncbi:hypothetical protein L596_016637 [Steinernema carpocapsae]|uniref:Uncharacterized protein n=1 Tax=Steinernema carpocapsae TaxID=34508 RepID=A0A4U5NJH3_STECR|nr:hypothetical protein L596_016637 [Steinernema carpocapsae]